MQFMNTDMKPSGLVIMRYRSDSNACRTPNRYRWPTYRLGIWNSDSRYSRRHRASS